MQTHRCRFDLVFPFILSFFLSFVRVFVLSGSVNFFSHFLSCNQHKHKQTYKIIWPINVKKQMPTHCNTLNSQRVRKSPFICVHVFQYAFNFPCPYNGVSLRFEKHIWKFVNVVWTIHSHSTAQLSPSPSPPQPYFQQQQMVGVRKGNFI